MLSVNDPDASYVLQSPAYDAVHSQEAAVRGEPHEEAFKARQAKRGSRSILYYSEMARLGAKKHNSA